MVISTVCITVIISSVEPDLIVAKMSVVPSESSTSSSDQNDTDPKNGKTTPV